MRTNFWSTAACFTIQVVALVSLASACMAGTINWVTSGNTNNCRNLAMNVDGQHQAYEVYNGSKWLVSYAADGVVPFSSRTASSGLLISNVPTFFTKGVPDDIWIAFYGSKAGSIGLYNFKFGDSIPAPIAGLPTLGTNYPAVKYDGTVVAYINSSNNAYNSANTQITTGVSSYIACDTNGSYIAFQKSNTVYVYSATNTTTALYSKAAAGATANFATNKPAISADYLAIQTAADAVSLYTLSSGALVRTLDGNAPVALSADGALLSCASTSADNTKGNTYLYKTDGTKVRTVLNTVATELTVSTTGPRIGLVSTAQLATKTSGANSDIFTWDYEPMTMTSIDYNYSSTVDSTSTAVSIDITNPEANLDSMILTASKKDGTLELPVSISATGSPRTMTITNGQTSGNETITVTASDGLSTLTRDYSITISSGLATKLAFTSTPMTVGAGSSTAPITVQRQDQYGNACTSDATRTVTLASSSIGGTFTPASPILIANGTSAVTFTYSDTIAGLPTLTAASTAPTTITSGTQGATILDFSVTGINKASVRVPGANITCDNAGGARGIELSGECFQQGDWVELRQADQPTITGSFITVNSSTSITCDFYFTMNNPGNWDVYVVRAGRGVALPGGIILTSARPHVVWVTTTTGVAGQSVSSEILGYGFASNATVKGVKGALVIPVPANNVINLGQNRLKITLDLTANTPAGDYQVIVTNPGTDLASLDNVNLHIFAAAPPAISTISPASVTNNQTDCLLTINGANFIGTPTVLVGAIPATDVVVTGGTKITCTVNISGVATGRYDVTVTNADGGSCTLADALAITAPELTAVTITANKTAPLVAGTTIALTANPTTSGSPTLDYEFHARYYNTATQLWVDKTLSEGFTALKDFSWTPTEALNYYVYVIAQERGTENQVVSAEQNYPISVPSLTSLSLTIGDKDGNNNVLLTATQMGTAPNIEYYFYGYNKVAGVWSSFTIRTYNGLTGNTATWTVTSTPTAYKVVVLARTIGSASAYQVASPIYNITR